MAVTLILKHLKSSDCISFENPNDDCLALINKELTKCDEKSNGFVCVSVSRPKRHRTTGEGSQNNLIWKLITLIANYTGDDSAGMIDTENGIKQRALSRGYPFHVSQITGQKIPESMRDIDTIQCSYLIDTAYEICSELGIEIPVNLEG